uniref:Zinc finger C3HC4 RING-type domain-containing protein n=1 Tax=Arundo donax TaxID=35708 RepID=A0A0A9EGE2_ARUDO
MIVLPDCAHTLCIRCFEDWYELFRTPCSASLAVCCNIVGIRNDCFYSYCICANSLC